MPTSRPAAPGGRRSPHARRRTLVAGAAGYVGCRLVSALHRDGASVIASARDVAALDRLDWPADVDTVRLDVTDPASVRAALAGAGGVDTAYYLVHALGGRDFARVDRESAATFGGAAAEAGVRRIVYLGGLVPDGEQLSEHLESRAEVGEQLQRSGVEVVWLRAAVVLGAGSASFEVIRAMVERLPVLLLPGWTQHPVQPVAIDDVLHYLVRAGEPSLPAGAYDVGGEETMSYADLVRAYAAHRGLRRVWLPVSGVTPGLAAPAVARLTPVPRGLVADLVHSLANSMRSTERRIRDLVPDPAGGLTGVAEAFTRIAASPRRTHAVGVHASPDPLHLVVTDPAWAGG